ncbi:MAG: thioredoxin family protein [Flavobacteriales bacterium]
MARTPTTIIPLGFKAPSFELTNVISRKKVKLDVLKGEKGTVIMFICNHCPFVIHIREALVKLANDYIPKGIGFIAISSNDVEKYPEDSPQKMAELAKSQNFPFPYLYDETQEVAKAYSAACTPDFSIFDSTLSCVYRGQLDDSRPENGIPITGNDIRNALNCLIENKAIDFEQKPSLGCNIKWK